MASFIGTNSDSAGELQQDQPQARAQERKRPFDAKAIWPLLKETTAEWKDDNASRLAAALSYYTLLSMSPLLVVAVSVAGLVFGEEAAKGQIAQQLESLVGPQAGAAIEGMLAKASTPSAGIIGTVVGLLVLLFGASGVFGELQSSLNTIWEVAPRPGRGLKGMLRDRFFSFTMVLTVAFLLLVSLVLSAGLAAVGKLFPGLLPGGEVVWQLVNFVVSMAAFSGLFALLFKFVPDVKIAWRDVWVGAVATAVLFAIGKLLIGLYLGHSTVTSPFGAAGSLVVIVVWAYYSAQILFFGAELTQVYARRHGSRVVPSGNAIAVTDGARELRGAGSGEGGRAGAHLGDKRFA